MQHDNRTAHVTVDVVKLYSVCPPLTMASDLLSDVETQLARP